MQILVDTMRVQSGMNSVYGTYTQEECRRMRAEVAVGKSHAPAAVAASSSPSADDAAASPVLIVGPKGTVVAVDSSSSTFATHRVTRKQRSQRTTAMRPCMQWNRGQPQCSATPCRFSHICMLCNADHRALDCVLNATTQAIVEQAAQNSVHGTVLPLQGSVDPTPAAASLQ
jgi:hypothetical protein